MKVIDRVISIPAPEAMRYAGELARKEGIFVGITAGATFAGALRVCAEAPKNSNVLCMLPDTGERYLSTPLFANVPVDMTPEELNSGQRRARSSPVTSESGERRTQHTCGAG
jgi:cysteine synthase A